jgi:lipopolysaccharide transport system ATP-binding protein
MSDVAIKVEGLSKAYQLGQIGTGTISRDLERWYARIRGKEDPFLRIGESNDQHSKSESNVVWSLKDINFEIKQGDAVGIIGRNGAGKSTLLKILSKVTAPTTGKISGKGRIASLLEVGTGFHPELSGRENIFLNGAILGMRKKEIQRKLEEIVDFAGIERYLDTPVKRYSSGMYVRLAFAVAAHLESEILIVDEVLAVGDAEFQKKSIGKMDSVSTKEGRTVLFVSHNMGTIMELCTSTIILKQGCLNSFGKSSSMIEKYYMGQTDSHQIVAKSYLPVYVKDIVTVNNSGLAVSNFSFNEKIRLRVTIGINQFQKFYNIGICLLRSDKKRVFTVNKLLDDFDIKKNKEEIVLDFIINDHLIAPMNYSFLIALNNKAGTITYEYLEDVSPIKVYDDGTTGLSFAEGVDYGCIIVNNNWELIKMS